MTREQTVRSIPRNPRTYLPVPKHGDRKPHKATPKTEPPPKFETTLSDPVLKYLTDFETVLKSTFYGHLLGFGASKRELSLAFLTLYAGIQQQERRDESMSAISSQCNTESSPANKEERLHTYLHQQTAEGNGEVYFKSKFIADDVGLSPKEIGALMCKLRDSVTELSIEKWSYTSATTWRVTTDG